MRIFICEELINNLESNIEKIKEIQFKIEIDNYEAYFIYTFALFESAFCEAIRHIINAFPEKISNEKPLSLSAKDIHINVFSPQEIFKILVENEIKKISKGSAKKIVEEAESICAVQLSYDTKRLDSISAIRNQITHENTPSRNRDLMHGDKLKTIENFRDNIAYLLGVLMEFSLKLEEKYSKYTKYKMLKEFWNIIFSTPLLRFEDCIYIRDGIMGSRKVVGFNFDHIEKVYKSISSGEKFFLSILFQQYSSSINDRFFKFSDIPMLVSVSDKNNIYMLLHIMTLYPYLFNGMGIEDIKKDETNAQIKNTQSK